MAYAVGSTSAMTYHGVATGEVALAGQLTGIVVFKDVDTLRNSRNGAKTQFCQVEREHSRCCTLVRNLICDTISGF